MVVDTPQFHFAEQDRAGHGSIFSWGCHHCLLEHLPGCPASFSSITVSSNLKLEALYWQLIPHDHSSIINTLRLHRLPTFVPRSLSIYYMSERASVISPENCGRNLNISLCRNSKFFDYCTDCNRYLTHGVSSKSLIQGAGQHSKDLNILDKCLKSSMHTLPLVQVVKNPPAQCRRCGFNLQVRRIPGGGSSSHSVL